VPHPLVLALFANPEAAARGARAMHDIGIAPEALSVVARNHDEEQALARVMGATPGAEIEDSRPAARIGEISAVVIAAAASVMPGAALVAAGPLAAELGEVAGHMAGGLADVLERAGLDTARAASWQRAVAHGQPMLGIHVVDSRVAGVEAGLAAAGALDVAVAEWDGDVPG
jgi:hypothetical protein